MSEIEVNPFEAFIPQNATVLIIGSFPGREQTQGINDEAQWFYGSKRNQFWRILSEVYQTELAGKIEKQNFFDQHGIGITDILLKVQRRNNNNLDGNLEIIEYNDQVIRQILDQFTFKSILFTSKYVGKHFSKLFPTIQNIDYLPSPSPRFARMSLSEKIHAYKQKLPQSRISNRDANRFSRSIFDIKY